MAANGTTIFLARHGGTVSSDSNRFAGASNPALSTGGREQAAALGRRLAARPLTAVYCSDMDRTIATATRIAEPHRLSPVPMAAFREINHGHWEGQVHADVEREFAAEFALWSADPFSFAPVAGETGAAVVARALPALMQIVRHHQGKQVAVVSHTATNRLLLCILLGIDPRRYRDRLAQELACLNVIEFDADGRAKILTLNDTHHYQPNSP